MEEKLYLFNPWKIKDWTEDMICQQVDSLIQGYNANADTMWELSKNCEVIANIQYLYGEMIARLTDEVRQLKMKSDTTESKAIVEERNKWKKNNPTEKMPAMSYFESIANQVVATDRELESKKVGMLTRFKYAYDSMEQKANAIKKKQESIKYEEFNK